MSQPETPRHRAPFSLCLACRPCVVEHLGEEAALEIEARWEAIERARGRGSAEGSAS